MSLPTARKLKIGAAIALVILAIVVILQNSESVETNVLFFSLRVPRAILLLVTLLTGVVIGIVLTSRLSSRRGDRKPTAEKKLRQEK